MQGLYAHSRPKTGLSAVFQGRFAAVDETWSHYYMSETREGFKQRDASRESGPKQAKTIPLTVKVKATVFYDSHRSLAKLKEINQKKILHFDNAPVHSSAVVVANLLE